MRNQTGKSGGDVVLVLLVDDEEHQRELTELNLVGVDPTLVITSTQTPSQALKLLSERPFDCLVSDYQMPGMNGVELCAEVRKTSTVPFIIYTGRGSEEVASQAFAAGVDDYVRKEKDLAHYQVLARRIRQAAERHRTSELYRVSVEANREGVSIIQGTEVVYANRAMAEMLGLRSPTELIGGSITRWLVEDDREPVVRRTLSRQGGRREPGVFHYSVRRADGEVRVLHASASIISYEGRPASIVFNHDDTEQMGIEDELRASNEELAMYSSSLEKMVNERTLGIKVASERLAAFINSASEGFSIYDSKLRIVDVNDAWLKRLPRGMTKSDVIGKHISDIYPGIEETPRYKEYLKVMKTGTPYNYEGYLAGDVVKRRYYFASVFKVGDGIGIVSRDATAHMELEREADETRRRLEAFMDSATEGFSLYDSELRLVDINRAVLNRFPKGTKEEDLIGKHITELYPGFEETEWYEAYKKVLETGVSWYGEGGGVGVMAGTYLSASAFKVGAGLGVVSKDISEHMEADEKLYESSLYARSLIEASLDPLVTISAEGKITDVNEATVQATGVPRGNLIGSDFSDYFTDPERARTGYKQVFSEGFVKDYPLTIRHASGKLTEVLYNATVYTNLVGEVTGVFAAARDVTEKNRLEKQLIRADRMDAVGKLTAMLAHDLRNPLNFIRQASDMALQEPERAKRLLQLIGENAERSLRMIEDLRSGTKEISIQRASTNLTQLIAKTAEEIKMPDGVEMEIATGEGVENVEVDAGLMRRVLDNLVTNAVEAMPEGGRLAIRTSVENGNVCIDVEDTGVGIPPEATPRIFDTFYSTKPKGLGLGLPFCRRAVEAHGGTLTFTSKKGAGTTFTVTLPKR